MRSLVLSFHKKAKSSGFWNLESIAKEIRKACTDVAKGRLEVLWIKGLPVDSVPPCKPTIWGQSFLFHLGSSSTIVFPPRHASLSQSSPRGLYTVHGDPHFVAYYVQPPFNYQKSVHITIVPSARVLQNMPIEWRSMLEKPFYRFSGTNPSIDLGWKSILTSKQTLEMYDSRRFTIDFRNHQSWNCYSKVCQLTGRIGTPLPLSPGDLFILNNHKMLHHIQDQWQQTQQINLTQN